MTGSVDPANAASRDSVLARLDEGLDLSGTIGRQTDKYFTNTRHIVEANGEAQVTYAVFLRRRAIAALEPAIRLIKIAAPEAGIKRYYEEGETVPAESKLLEITGAMSQLSELETLLLQRTGFSCISANNAYKMCTALPGSVFMDMHARHATGSEMNILAAYGAAVGSDAARRDNSSVKGFCGSSQDLTAPLYGARSGIGTMPHALVGYTRGDVVEAMKLFVAQLPGINSLIALVDYNGEEIGDALKCARWFYEDEKLDKKGKTFGVRLDTHGGRFAEGLDYEKSVEVAGNWLGVHGEYNIVEQVLGQRAVQLDAGNILVDKVRRILFGSGVSVASIIHTRLSLNAAGFNRAQIVASSGFDAQKCQVMGAANAPLDMVGTGSFLPATMAETYATADIIAYDGTPRVKVGREFLLEPV